jgi:Protein of unknown function (DUF3570)
MRADSDTALPPLGASLLAAALALPLAAPVHAESAPERGLVSLKYLDYLDRQPGADRIRVKAPSALVVAPLSGNWALSGTLVSDAISGASPAYRTEQLTGLTDHRRAGTADITRYFPRGTLTLGAAISSEADYLSRALALQGTLASEDKNTTWSAGLAHSGDVINPSTRVVKDEKKNVLDLNVGVTQVMGVADIVQINLGWSRGRGYFTDPYKLFDERPRERDRSTLLLRWNHHFDGSGGTLRSSWRYFHDNWQVRAHTLGFEYVQPLGGGWSVMPLLRLYTQSAAEFYVNEAASTDDPFAPNPATAGTYHSSDQRLSGFGAVTLGLKVAKQINADWSADVKFETYKQRGSWRAMGGGSTGLADFLFRSVQVGVATAF